MASTLTVAPTFDSNMEFVATALFALAIAHTFLAKRLNNFARRYPEGSILENLFHLLGEIEVVFGIWGGLFFAFIWAYSDLDSAVAYMETRNLTEPLFVFVIMAICATRPVLDLAKSGLVLVERVLPLPGEMKGFVAIFAFGPLTGSLITEPAAMTVCALISLERFFLNSENLRFKYATLGLLFVNISVGGTLTHFAAPPVLMVASTWGWDLSFMLIHFGWKATACCFGASIVTAFAFRSELTQLMVKRSSEKTANRGAGDDRQGNSDEGRSTGASPWWLQAIHAGFVAAVVYMSHHPVIFTGLFLFFLGLVTVTREFQTELKLKEGLLVGFFLGGLVVLGGPQGWWLAPLLSKLSELPLFLGATALTAVTDNAALTYLGSLVPDLSDAAKLALVGGAVTGGGLTVIANAPNPAGYGILNSSFGPDGISPLGLLIGAFGPTLLAVVLFGFL